MAMQEASPAAAAPPPAQVVGHAFVTQYYHILHQSPEYVYKFYQDTSSLSRPDSNGVMTSVTTMQAINNTIMSFGYGNQKAEIETADAQESFKEGVIVLVTGCLIGKDSVRRKFAQTFFLAPQEKGYFVLNDVLRYVDNVSAEVRSVSAKNVVEDTPVGLPSSDPEPIPSSDPPSEPAQTFETEILKDNTEVYEPTEQNNGPVLAEVDVNEPPTTQANPNEANTVVVSDSSAPQEKISYASIVKVARASAPIYVPANRTKAVPANVDRSLPVATTPSPHLETSLPVSESVSENANTVEEGHSIYVRNLPLDAAIEQLHEVFKIFGPIKPNGVQVRSIKLQGYCFGFVEFESSDSMLAAVKASPLTIGDRQSVVEEKRTNQGGGGGGSGRYVSTGRGGFRNENFRGRGNFNRNRAGYGMHEPSSGRGRGGPSGGRGSEGYRRIDHRVGPQGGTNKSSVPGERT